MFQRSVGGEDRIVWFNDRSGDLCSRERTRYDTGYRIGSRVKKVLTHGGEGVCLPEEPGRWRIPIYFSFRSLPIVFPSIRRWIRNRYRRRTSGKWGNLVDRYIGRPTCEFYPILNRRFPFQWCSDRERSCWPRPPFRWSIVPGGIIVCTCRFWPHLRDPKRYPPH